MADHIRTSGWIRGGPFPRGRPAPYDVVIACAERSDEEMPGASTCPLGNVL